MATEEKEEKLDTGEEKQVRLPIEWVLPDEMPTPFATNMTIQTLEDEFKISFFEVKPKLHLDRSQPFPENVKAVCVASVIVTAKRLPSFIEVLQSQLDNYNSTKQKKEMP